MAIGRKPDGTVGSVGGEANGPTGQMIRTGPTIVQREELAVNHRDVQNARLLAIEERVDAYNNAGEPIPDHLAGLLKEARAAGEKRETRQGPQEPVPPKPASTPEDYSVNLQGYPVPRFVPEHGTALPDTPAGEYATQEPVEKYPDFANPAKRGDLIPDEAHRRNTVPEELKSGDGKTEEEIKEDREGEAAKAAEGKPVTRRRAVASPPKGSVVAPSSDQIHTPAAEEKPARGRPSSSK